MASYPFPPNHMAPVVFLSAVCGKSKPLPGEQIAKGMAIVAPDVIPCDTDAVKNGREPPKMTVDKPADILSIADARSTFRTLVERGQWDNSAEELRELAIEDIASFADVDILATFGSRLREARKRRRVRQEEIAELVGASRQSVGNWEAARRRPNALSESDIRKICEFLRVRYEWVRFGQPPMDAVEASAATPAASAGDIVKASGSAAPTERAARLKAAFKAARAAFREIEDLLEE